MTKHFSFVTAAGSIVDASQEMMTLGLCNIFGSFVQAMPTCGAFTRSAVSNASGVRTPLAGLYTGTNDLCSHWWSFFLEILNFEE